MKNLYLLTVFSLVVGSVALVRAGDGRGRSPKKGIGLITVRENKDSWRAKVRSLDVQWHYSWGAEIPSNEPENVEFVPMIWGGRNPESDRSRAMIEALTEAGKDEHVAHLLGFNEPDSDSQANLLVEQALGGWPALMTTGLRLGSPACVHPDNDWMQRFMREADEKKFRVDFVCVHWYGGPNAKSLVDRLRKIHKLYGKPIWITEFAVADWKAKKPEDNKHKPEQVLAFMKEILPALDRLEFVERYAWFPADETSARLSPSALFHEDGSLTTLGRFYAKH